MPRNKLLLAAALVLVTIGLGVAIYFVFFRAVAVPPALPPAAPPPITGLPPIAPGVPPTIPPTVPPTLPRAPEIASGGPTTTTPLTEQGTRGATLASDGRSVAYYDQTDSTFYRVTADGSISRLSNKQFFDVQTVTWAPGANRAVLEYPDGANILFDFLRDEQVTLPKHWEDFSFSADGARIASKSIGINPDNRWLVISSADGSEAQAIEALGENANRVTVAWSPSSEVVAFSATGDSLGFDTSEILLVGQNHENFKSLIVEGRDFRPLWSADGSKLLYSVYSSENGYRPMLWLTDARGESIGGNRQSLGLNTWADKCTVADAKIIYCAVPTELPEGYGFQPTLAATIPDQIYRIDIESGTKTLIGSPAEQSSMSRLSVSEDERFLFYTEATTGILRKMILK